MSKPKKNTCPPTPECDRLTQVRDQSQPIGEFLDWLRNEKGWELCYRHKHTGLCYDEDGNKACGYREHDMCPAHYQTETLLAEFFEIDLKKVEAERLAVLRHVRKQNETRQKQR